MIRIFLADDHQIFKDSIRLLLSFEDDMEIVGEASGGMGVLDGLKEVLPDVILMDVSMRDLNGIETTRLVKKTHPKVKVLILTMNTESDQIVKAMEAGVDGYLSKDAGKGEVLNAIRAVFQGSTHLSKDVSAKLVQHLAQSHHHKTKEEKKQNLTPRETEVLRLIAQEYSNPEIAEKLYISVRTVDSHRRNLLEKLAVKNTAGLVRYAIENGLV